MGLFETIGIFRRPPDARSDDEVDAEVRLELELHLELTAERLAREGMEAERAEEEARRRFGDYERARRDCVRVEIGERILMQRIHVVATVVLAVCLLCMVWQNLLLRSESARAQDELRDTLSALMFELDDGRRSADERPTPAPIVIGVGDTLELVDLYNQDLNTVERVAADGMVLVPSVGWVSVAGLTRPEAEAALSAALEPYYVQSDVKLKVNLDGDEE